MNGNAVESIDHSHLLIDPDILQQLCDTHFLPACFIIPLYHYFLPLAKRAPFVQIIDGILTLLTLEFLPLNHIQVLLLLIRNDLADLLILPELAPDHRVLRVHVDVFLAKNKHFFLLWRHVFVFGKVYRYLFLPKNIALHIHRS